MIITGQYHFRVIYQRFLPGISTNKNVAFETDLSCYATLPSMLEPFIYGLNIDPDVNWYVVVANVSGRKEAFNIS